MISAASLWNFSQSGDPLALGGCHENERVLSIDAFGEPWGTFGGTNVRFLPTALVVMDVLKCVQQGKVGWDSDWKNAKSVLKYSLLS